MPHKLCSPKKETDDKIVMIGSQCTIDGLLHCAIVIVGEFDRLACWKGFCDAECRFLFIERHYTDVSKGFELRHRFGRSAPCFIERDQIDIGDRRKMAYQIVSFDPVATDQRK